MAIGISAFQTLYQTYYPDAELPYLVPKSAVLLNLALGGNTDGQFSGDQIDMPWLLSPAVGGSQTFSVAQNAAANAPGSLRPIVRLSQFYKIFSFLDKDELQSRGPASYGDLMETTVRGSRNDFLNNIDQILHSNGSGNRAGFTYASATPTVCTLLSASAGMNNGTTYTIGAGVGQQTFEVGDSVVITSTNPTDGTAPTIVSGPYQVSAVDGNANTVTLASAPSGLTDTYVYGLAKTGDTLGFSTALLTPSIIGVAAFNPYGGVTTTDSFLGVNRSTYGARASGTWLNASTGYSTEQAIRKALTNMRNTGLDPQTVTVAMHPDDYDSMDFKATTQNRYAQHEIGVFFFDALAVNSTMGQARIVVDAHQERGQARLYAENAIELRYNGGLPHFSQLKNGTDEQFGSNYDGREMRMRAYMQTRIRDPRKLGVVKLPAAA